MRPAGRLPFKITPSGVISFLKASGLQTKSPGKSRGFYLAFMFFIVDA
jgi:hypothetical protein